MTPREVQDIYREGFEAGVYHRHIPRKFPPLGVAWLRSNARMQLGLPIPADRQIQRLSLAWKEATGKERELIHVPLEEF
jgi:hypothetical protein